MLDSHTLQRARHPRASNSFYRPDIDGLRAGAVLAVIVNHFDPGLLPGGYLGVDIFFVISGYVITGSLTNYPHATLSSFITSFYARRMKRLLPVLCAFVLVTVLLGSLFVYPSKEEYKNSLMAALYAILGSSNIYLYLRSVDYFGASAELNLFSHTWSLGVEEQFYVIYPFLLWCTFLRQGKARFGPVTILSIACMASFVGYIVANKVNPMQAYFLMPPRFWELGAGCIAYFVTPPGTPKTAAPIAIVSFLALCFSLFPDESAGLYMTPVAVLSTAFLIAWTKPGGPMCNFLCAKPLVWIGLISYSLYLWHWSVFVIARLTFGLTYESAPILILIIFGLASLSYYYVELPFRTMSWGKSGLRAILKGGLLIVLSFTIVQLILVPFRGAFYLGEKTSLIDKGIHTLAAQRYRQGQLLWTPKDCVLQSDSDVGKKINLVGCALRSEHAAKRRFLVIGNSFSAAEFEMYSVLDDEGLGQVSATSAWAVPPVPQSEYAPPWAKSNAYYWDSVIPSLLGELKAGDVVIMVNDLTVLSPHNSSEPNRIDVFKQALASIARSLEPKGIQIIFQGGLPFMRDAHCNPDLAKPQWFHVGGQELCRYYSRADSLKRLSPITEAIIELSREYKNFHVLDLFDVYCPGSVCRFYTDDGIFLYRDAIHPSVEANLRARGPFLELVKKVIQNSGAECYRGALASPPSGIGAGAPRSQNAGTVLDGESGCEGAAANIGSK